MSRCGEVGFDARCHAGDRPGLEASPGNRLCEQLGRRPKTNGNAQTVSATGIAVPAQPKIPICILGSAYWSNYPHSHPKPTRTKKVSPAFDVALKSEMFVIDSFSIYM